MTVDRRRFVLGLAPVPEDQRARFGSTGISREKEAKVLAAWKARK